MLLQPEQIQGAMGFVPLPGTNPALPVYGHVQFIIGKGIQGNSDYIMPAYFLPYGSLGSITNPIQISAASDLAQLVNSSLCYIFMQSINLAGVTISPVTGFTGNIDGRNYEIYNGTVNCGAPGTGTGSAALFKNCGGTINNLGVNALNISGGGGNITISAPFCVEHTGTVNKCWAIDCTLNSPTVGFAGFVGAPYSTAVFNDCFSVGVTNPYDTRGGFADGTQHGNSASFNRCYCVSTGFDFSYGQFVFSHCYYNSTTSAGSLGYTGVTGLTDAQMKVAANFSTFDFTTIWNESASINSSYPSLYFSALATLPCAIALVTGVAAKYKGSAIPAILAAEDITHKQYTDAGDTDCYIDDVLQTGKKVNRFYNVNVASNGIATKYLTSDGATKSSGNTFLLSSVILACGFAKALGTGLKQPFPCPFQYSATTGLLQVQFEEDHNTAILLGGNVDGLEDAPSGTAVVLWVAGIK